MPERKMKKVVEESIPDSNGKVDYDDSDNPNFCNKYERSARVEGYGNLGIAPGYEETDGEEESESGFLKSNNVQDRI